jgi:hypothetical protein
MRHTVCIFKIINSYEILDKSPKRRYHVRGHVIAGREVLKRRLCYGFSQSTVQLQAVEL